MKNNYNGWCYQCDHSKCIYAEWWCRIGEEIKPVGTYDTCPEFTWRKTLWEETKKKTQDSQELHGL